MITRFAFFGCLLFFVPSDISAQQIHKWQDEKGQWHFSQMPGRGAAPIIRVIVEKINYRNGYLTLDGTIENISGYIVTVPSIQVRASDAENELMLSDGSARGAGGYKAKLEPQKSTVFSATLKLPDKARGREVKLDLTVEEYPFEIEWRGGNKMKIW